jgi:hypothetical protein
MGPWIRRRIGENFRTGLSGVVVMEIQKITGVRGGCM